MVKKLTAHEKEIEALARGYRSDLSILEEKYKQEVNELIAKFQIMIFELFTNISEDRKATIKIKGMTASIDIDKIKGEKDDVV